MADAAAAYVRRLHEEGRCDGILAAGGSGNTAIAGHRHWVHHVGGVAAKVSIWRAW